jgi:hypothetical protein
MRVPVCIRMQRDSFFSFLLKKENPLFFLLKKENPLSHAEE